MKISVVDSLVSSIIVSRELEYIILDRTLHILESSSNSARFSEFPEAVTIGRDVRVGFPELCGTEDIIESIARGDCQNFKLQSLAKHNPKTAEICYVDLYIGYVPAETVSERRIILLLEDTTEQSSIQQKLFQKVNESSLLETAWSESQAYLNKIINSMADALIVTDGEGIIKKINPAARSMFGYGERDPIDRPISMLSPEFDRLPKSSQTSNSSVDLFRDIEISCTTQAGKNIIVSFSCSQLKTEFSDVPDLVYLGKDITKRVRSQARLLKSLEKEKKLNEFKSNFVSAISSEIRTPLNTLLLASELLKDIHREERDEIVKSIEVNVRRLAQIVEDVLTIAQTEMATDSPGADCVDVTRCCREIVNQIQLGLGDSQRLKFVETDPIEVSIDLKIVEYILTNLIGNVIKYSLSNIEISVKRDRFDRELFLEVFDPDYYLPREERENLLSANNTSNLSGMGLELALVQKYVEIHGGRIELESQVGTGTVFRVVLPVSSYTIGDR
ncbi:MAG TPA: PAS domain S-box protein [Oscillatoriales cyanobacterium M59_W2019_021]|nr:PAS domain S-box protein [Oscillatoriales cyanobacterium M59_W2019_021]